MNFIPRAIVYFHSAVCLENFITGKAKSERSFRIPAAAWYSIKSGVIKIVFPHIARIGVIPAKRMGT
jgi:hypothetical protein